MATDGHENHAEYMALGEELSEKCGDIGGERCEQSINFDKCMEDYVKDKDIDIPFL